MQTHIIHSSVRNNSCVSKQTKYKNVIMCSVIKIPFGMYTLHMPCKYC